MSENFKQGTGCSDDGTTFQQERFQARCLAMQYLYGCDVSDDWGPKDEVQSEFLALICKEEVKNPYIFRKCRKYAHKLIHSCCEHRAELDGIIAVNAVNWAMNRMSAVDRSILRLATCEMCYFGKVSPATVINEAVEVAKKYGDADSTKFINGVMESIRKNRNQIILPMKDEPDDDGDLMHDSGEV